MSQSNKPFRGYIYTVWLGDLEITPSRVDKKLSKAVEDGEVKYYAFQEEIAPSTERRHLQLYIEFVKPQRGQRIERLLGLRKEQYHGERRRGTPAEASDYCTKVRGSDLHESILLFFSTTHLPRRTLELLEQRPSQEGSWLQAKELDLIFEQSLTELRREQIYTMSPENSPPSSSSSTRASKRLEQRSSLMNTISGPKKSSSSWEPPVPVKQSGFTPTLKPRCGLRRPTLAQKPSGSTDTAMRKQLSMTTLSETATTPQCSASAMDIQSTPQSKEDSFGSSQSELSSPQIFPMNLGGQLDPKSMPSKDV